MTSRTIRGDGLSLAVTERGPVGAPVIVLVHGYPDSQRVWRDVARELEPRYRVVTYDVRGAGDSDVPTKSADYALAHLAADLEAVLDATASGKRAHVVGHDWGSIQSWEAATEPRIAAKLASFTAISGPCLDHVGYWMRHDASPVAAARQAVMSWYIYAMHAARVAPGAWGTVMKLAVPRIQARTEGIARDPVREASLASDAARGIGLYVANMGPRLLRPRERTTDLPVQIVSPTEDAYVSAAMTAHIDRFVPNLVRRSVPGGHWQPLSHPKETASWIEEHVARVESGAGVGTVAPPDTARDMTGDAEART